MTQLKLISVPPPDAIGSVYADVIYLIGPRFKSESGLQLLFESLNANVSICLVERNSSISTVIPCAMIN